MAAVTSLVRPVQDKASHNFLQGCSLSDVALAPIDDAYIHAYTGSSN